MGVAKVANGGRKRCQAYRVDARLVFAQISGKACESQMFEAIAYWELGTLYGQFWRRTREFRWMQSVAEQEAEEEWWFNPESQLTWARRLLVGDARPR